MRPSRRAFLGHTVACTAAAAAAADHPPLLQSLEKQVLVPEGGPGPLWFHPRACRMATGMLMTLQPIMGSDFFGPVHFTLSSDDGATWLPFTPVPSLGHVPTHDDWREAVCDVTPAHHPHTDSVLALGHNVFYRGDAFERSQPARWPVYAVWRNGAWGPRRKLDWDDPRGSFIYSNNCGQRVVMPDGDVMMSFTFGVKDKPRAVCGVRCGFDGESLLVKETGPALTNDAGRGLLEPSLTHFQERFYLTIRAEDGRGYVAVSDDGLRYEPQQAWRWDDGTPLEMSSTQQHWLVHSEGLFLVYTRRDPSNEKIVRWRAPLWVAQVDVTTLRLIRASERVVLPIVGDATSRPETIAFNGNFGVANATPHESWITDGSWCPKTNRGELALVRATWSRPNHVP